MPDISMCAGGDCPKKQQCYRYTATANPMRQSYFGVLPYNSDTNSCVYYMPMVKRDINVRETPCK